VDTTSVFLPDLLAELPITDGGTLSKTLYRSETLRLVGFAFAEGQELTEHSSALAVTIQVVRGRLGLTLGDQPEVELDGSGWVHMPPRLPHSVRALEPSVMLLTMYGAASTKGSTPAGSTTAG
jgi:quercetin dioxygenase-like cupin family protein